MKRFKRALYYTVIPLVASFGASQFGKMIALRHLSEKDTQWNFNIFRFILHFNYGVAFNIFSESPEVLKVVHFSTIGGFILSGYIFLHYLMNRFLLVTRLGLSLVMGGILSNVLDRVQYGYSIDYIALGQGPVFNIADVVQWLGYLVLSYALLRERKLLWSGKESRKSNWVDGIFQLKYCSVLLAMGFCFATIAGLFGFTFLKVVLSEHVTRQDQSLLWVRYYKPFLFDYCLVCSIFFIALIVVGRELSHRIAGPIYGFQMFLDDLLRGKVRPFRMRAQDEFKHLEELAEELSEALRHGYEKD